MQTFSPEQLLDHLHQLDVPSLFSPDLPLDEVKKSAKITKQKVRLLKRQIRQEMDVIKARWDGRKAYEAQQERLHLAPYLVLERLVSQVEVAISELEIRGSVNWRPHYGDTLVGNFDTGEWHILPLPDAILWQAKDTKRQIQELEGLVTQGERNIEELTLKIEERKRGNKSSSILYAFFGLISIGVMTAFSGNSTSPELPLLLLGAGAFMVIFGIAGYFASDTPDKELQQRLAIIQHTTTDGRKVIRKLKDQLVELKGMYEQAKRESLP